MRKVLIIGLTLAAAMLIGTSPVLAGELDTHGVTAACKYGTIDGDDFAGHAKIKRILVTPPTMFAKSGHKKVGWRFEVNRTYLSDPAETTYQSSTRTAIATTTSPASFQQMNVGVVVPNIDEPSWLTYRVTIKLFWYRANGSVQSKTSFLMPSYNLHYNGEWDNGYSRCDPIIRWGP